MKKHIIIIATIASIIGFILGVYIYNISNQEEFDVIAQEMNESYTKISAQIKQSNSQAVSSETEKTSPNTIIITKKLYKKCNHTIQNVQKINQSLVNLSEEEFRKKYNEYEIQKFNNKEIILYQEVNEFCNEHYLIKEKEGYIEIYSLDEYDKVTRLFQVTDIATKYLPEVDRKKIKEGIKVCTNLELNKILEDFE